MVVAEEVHPQDGKANGGEEEGPREPSTAEGEGEPLLAPARDGGAAGPCEERTTWHRRRGVGKDGEGGSGVDEETPVGCPIGDEDQMAGGDGVETPPAA